MTVYQRRSLNTKAWLASILLVGLIWLSSAGIANAVTLFWDQSGTLNGNGNWDTTTANWTGTAVNAAPTLTWNPNDGTVDASFNGAAGTGATTGTVTLTTTINANSVILANTGGNYNITGGALNLTSTSASVVMNTNATSTNGETISSAIGGTTITVANNFNGATNAAARTLLLLNGTNTFTGDLILGGTGVGNNFTNANQVSINTATALPATATVKFDRNFSQLLFTAGGNAVGGTTNYTAIFNNNINLNDTGVGTFSSGIGAAN